MSSLIDVKHTVTELCVKCVNRGRTKVRNYGAFALSKPLDGTTSSLTGCAETRTTYFERTPEFASAVLT